MKGESMNIILGFGSQEEKVRNDVKSALLNEGEVALKRWNDDADKFDKIPRKEAPERYTRIFYYDNKLVFHHINRQHPFSPDGWALMKVEEPFEIDPVQPRSN